MTAIAVLNWTMVAGLKIIADLRSLFPRDLLSLRRTTKPVS
ncbi:MAG: hypothetical protein AB1796_08000 [Bacillota bacterium]